MIPRSPLAEDGNRTRSRPGTARIVTRRARIAGLRGDSMKTAIHRPAAVLWTVTLLMAMWAMLAIPTGAAAQSGSETDTAGDELTVVA